MECSEFLFSKISHFNLWCKDSTISSTYILVCCAPYMECSELSRFHISIFGAKILQFPVHISLCAVLLIWNAVSFPDFIFQSLVQRFHNFQYIYPCVLCSLYGMQWAFLNLWCKGSTISSTYILVCCAPYMECSELSRFHISNLWCKACPLLGGSPFLGGPLYRRFHFSVVTTAMTLRSSQRFASGTAWSLSIWCL